jgi:hypothetical protein
MTKKSFLRKVAAIAVCLAVTTVFAGCEKDPIDDPDGTGNVDGIDVPDAIYYGDEQNALQIALRNVRIKYFVEDPGCDLSIDCDEPKYGEAMICKGRYWFKTNFVGPRGENLFREHWYGYDADNDGTYRGYSFTKNETCQLIDCSYYMLPEPFSISSGMARDAAAMLELYYGLDSRQNYWNEPYTKWYGSVKISTTTVHKTENAKTIAGRLCNAYTVVETLYSGDTSMDFTQRKVWYDPETNLAMRLEAYDVYGLSYIVEITEIEYGKVTVGQLDKILDDYLKTHSPADVSDDENPGWDW